MPEITMHAPVREFLQDPQDPDDEGIWLWSVIAEALGTDGKLYGMTAGYPDADAEDPEIAGIHHANLRRALENQMRNAGAWADVV